MKKLYLHIGLGKTGSSALQSWLSLNAERLARQGIDYADTVPEVKFGESLSGNGTPLHRACVAQAFDEVESLLRSTYFFRPGNTVAIISCELLQGLKPATIEALKSVCDRNGIAVTVVAYTRSVYEALYSTYVQFVKRGACTHRFGEDPADLGVDRSVDYLQRYAEVFGNDMVVLNYDQAKDDIYASFAAVTGIERKGLKELGLKVNRSLSFEEVETLRRINALHEGAFSTPISNFVIAQSPSLSTPVFYDEALVRQVRETAAAGVDWINRRFELDPPLQTDRYTGSPSTRPDAPAFDAYRPVLRWAEAFAPAPAQRAQFARFLREFSALVVEFSGEDALALLRRANAVQKEVVEQEPEAAADDEPGVAPVSPRYLVSYFLDRRSPAVTAEGSTFAARFHDWLGLMDARALGSTINPLEDTRVLGAPGAAAREPPMSGYSVIQADGIEEVVALAERCPLLDVGGVVEVSRIVMLYQPGGAPPADVAEEA